MVQIDFIGVGEAFEPELGSSSMLVSFGEDSVLVDCGYGAVANLFSRDFLSITSLYITHLHADHVFGVPSLLFRSFQDGRTLPFTIVGQPGSREYITKLCETAYPGMCDLLSFELRFVETKESGSVGKLKFKLAETNHPLTNFAALISHDEFEDKVAVSGDGTLTDSSKKLFKEANVLVHEGFRISESVWGHESAANVVELCDDSTAIKQLAFVHIDRHERPILKDWVCDLPSKKYKILVPEPKDIIEV